MIWAWRIGACVTEGLGVWAAWELPTWKLCALIMLWAAANGFRVAIWNAKSTQRQSVDK